MTAWPEARAGIIIVAWNSEQYLSALSASLRQAGIPDENRKIFIVDNGSSDDSVRILENFQSDAASFVDIICNASNRGFAAACNQGAKAAMEWGAEYLYFLNPDTEVAPGFLAAAWKAFQVDARIGQVQSLTLRQGGTRIQSWGNCLTFLGFGYSGGDGELISKFKVQSSKSLPEIGYASGAAMLVPARVWQEVGGFDEFYGSYHEDTDLSLRIRLAGYRIVLASSSRVVHKYEFSRSITKYYLIERNRLILVFKFFKMRTLALLAPAFLVMEAGTLGYSLIAGFWREKIKAYGWVLSHMGDMWHCRKKLQRMRKLGDRALAPYLVARIDFQEVMNPLLQYVVNPAMAAYWNLVKWLIRW